MKQHLLAPWRKKYFKPNTDSILFLLKWGWASLWPPMAFFALVILAWHLATVAFEIPPYLLPGPERVFRAVASNAKGLAKASLNTGKAALAGLGMSLAAGTLIALAFAEFPLVRRACYPYAIFLQTVPIVAIAPLIILWCGNGFWGVTATVFIISLFPMVANGTAGLIGADPRLLELFAVNNASRWQTLLKLRFPGAIPRFAEGLKISAGLSVIGAIVGEFVAGFGSEAGGLGRLIVVANAQLKTAELFAAVFASTLLGLAIFAAVGWIDETLLARWRRPV